ncbi:hypothetical protein DVU_3321 [Nitratidesulfovibrio vulgaris str. Hildenborough]|uniref:Uncharacterized protein n=1 Tax=Nitratidesulfovibrio vulgaris (strain ATCC 29579 / DSM 644 / CCUG 34227 / NCIMB 8303 / VKM B-1760 / Hildenborough) TaxID=882 RepID=Q725V4_NITV2|nr:hypothetical protein DVU_3321 [Nitratidesulfovibrio vulgaris str. Hildenborough]
MSYILARCMVVQRELWRNRTWNWRLCFSIC